MKKLQIEATIPNLSQVISMTDELLEANECPVRTQTAIDIAVEEIFVNIANYAYESGTGMAEICAEVSQDTPKKITISFTDQGIPFDPLAKPDPDVTLSADERAIGGLGIYMVKNTMDSVHYERVNNSNIFTMTKELVDSDQ